MANLLLSFLWKYLAGPVVADAQGSSTASWGGTVAQTGYNPFNTFAWAIIALVLVYGFYLLFERLEIEFDLQTVLYSLPFVLLGGFLRFLEDTGIIPFPFSILAITPVIYLFIAFIYLGALSISYRLKKEDLDRYVGIIGTLILIPVFIVSLIKLIEFGADLLFVTKSLIVSGVLTSVFYFYVREKNFSIKIYTLAGFSQFFGGTVSMLSVAAGGTQKQILAQTATSILGPAGILVVKAGLLGIAVYLLEDIEDVRTEALVLLALIVVGLATGLRVMLRTAAGV